MAWIGQTGAEKAAFTARPSRGLFGKTPFVGGAGDYRQSERDSQNALEGDPVSARPKLMGLVILEMFWSSDLGHTWSVQY
jgi:hypothetical protein